MIDISHIDVKINGMDGLEKKYLPRIIDATIGQYLEIFGAVLITGPKWCGKTTTARQHAKSNLFMQDMADQEADISLADLKPSLLLEGDNPRLIDEWQMLPKIWDAVRHSVDMRGETGLYILTGSTSVDEKTIKHSGAGRIARLIMHTLSLYESNDSSGAVSLELLFNEKPNVSAVCSLDVEDYARFIVRGGWPGTIDKSDSSARLQIAEYCETIVRSDIKTVDGVKRDAQKVRALLRSYARHVGTSATLKTLQADVAVSDESLHINTIPQYLDALGRLYVISDVPAWNPRLRSKSTVRTSSVRHFIDPALAATFLHANARDILFDIKTFGFLFESLSIRDLRVYAQRLGGEILHYLDSSGLEADAVIHLRDGRWAAVEVKLGAKQVDQAAENLLRLKSSVNTDKMNEPEFLMIITGSKYAYKREDGVYVVPLGLLGP